MSSWPLFSCTGGFYLRVGMRQFRPWYSISPAERALSASIHVCKRPFSMTVAFSAQDFYSGLLTDDLFFCPFDVGHQTYRVILSASFLLVQSLSKPCMPSAAFSYRL